MYIGTPKWRKKVWRGEILSKDKNFRASTFDSDLPFLPSPLQDQFNPSKPDNEVALQSVLEINYQLKPINFRREYAFGRR